jgi:Acyl-CoA synthetases (AMP-forming)/AMP-acid ligases II
VIVDPTRRAAIEPIARAHGAGLETLDARGGGSFVEPARGQKREYADAERGADDLAALLYTSGTTGRSKGAMLTQENLLSNAQVLSGYWRFTTDDVLLHALPIFHTHGLFVATNVVLAAGASMIFLPKFDAAEIMRAAAAGHIAHGRADLLCAALAAAGADHGGDAPYPPLRLRLGPASGGDPPGLVGAHGPRHPRALRHDRDEYEYLQPL